MTVLASASVLALLLSLLLLTVQRKVSRGLKAQMEFVDRPWTLRLSNARQGWIVGVADSGYESTFRLMLQNSPDLAYSNSEIFHSYLYSATPNCFVGLPPMTEISRSRAIRHTPSGHTLTTVARSFIYSWAPGYWTETFTRSPGFQFTLGVISGAVCAVGAADGSSGAKRIASTIDRNSFRPPSRRLMPKASSNRRLRDSVIPLFCHSPD